jgi:ABC-2 type transport system permease protein
MLFLIRWIYRRYCAREPGPPDGGTSRSSSSGLAQGRLLLLLHQTRYEVISFMRNKQARFFTLFLPLALMVIFVGVFGSSTVGPDHVKASTYYVPGLCALAVIATSFMNLVISVTAQREAGILKRRRATPVPASVLVVGRVLSAMAVSLVVVTVLIAVAHLAYGTPVPLQAVPTIALMAIVGSVTFGVLGYAVSSLIGSSDAAQPIVQAIMLPLYFISGVFVPSVELPSSLQNVATFFPVEHLADAFRHAFHPAVHGSWPAWTNFAVLAIWLAAGLIVALRRFRWAPSNAAA